MASVSDHVIIEFCGEPLAFTRSQLDEARVQARELLPVMQTAIVAPPAQLVDAEALSVLTSLPKSWLEEQARRERIPSLQLGKYRRFNVTEALAAIRKLGRPP
jgi:hypothetical protein